MKESTDLSFVKDSDLHYVCCSHAFAVMAGLPNESDVEGKTDYDLFESTLAGQYRADDHRLIRTKQALIDYVQPFPGPDGGLRYAVTSKYLLYDPSGNIIGIYGIGRETEEP